MTEFYFEAPHGGRALVTIPTSETITVHGVCNNQDCDPCTSIVIQVHNLAAEKGWEVVYHDFETRDYCPCCGNVFSISINEKHCPYCDNILPNTSECITECKLCEESTVDLHTIPTEIGKLVFTKTEPEILCDHRNTFKDPDSPFVYRNGVLCSRDFDTTVLHPDYWMSLRQYFIDIGYTSIVNGFEKSLPWICRDHFVHLVKTGHYYRDENPWVDLIHDVAWSYVPEKFRCLKDIGTWDRFNVNDFTVI